MARLRARLTLSHIEGLYHNRVRSSSGPGNDGLNVRRFDEHLRDHARTIQRKVLEGSYNFTSYRERLFSKGRDKPPRVVSIPTIRDKIVLGILREAVHDSFLRRYGQVESVHRIVARVKEATRRGRYDRFLRLDVRGFYGSIDHELLFAKTRRLLGKQETVAHLVERAVQTPTVPYRARAATKNARGVPEGLPISNILANLYMAELDTKLAQHSDFLYARFVDDILVLGRRESMPDIEGLLQTELANLRLESNPDKRALGSIDDGFTYLGYQFSTDTVSVSEASVRKLERSLERLFAQGVREQPDYFKFHVDLRITGCRFSRRKYGWLFFFSQLDDMTLLFRLDWLVRKLAGRFGVSATPFRRFVRAYHEITKGLPDTHYVPNFDKHSTAQKRRILTSVFRMPADQLDDDGVTREFNRVLAIVTRDLERDLRITS